MSNFRVGDIVQCRRVLNQTDNQYPNMVADSYGIVLSVHEEQLKINWVLCTNWSWARLRRREHPDCDAHMGARWFTLKGTSDAPPDQKELE